MAASLLARPFLPGRVDGPPKIEAVCHFVEATGKSAAIGQLRKGR